jgi:hypothetical protein
MATLYKAPTTNFSSTSLNGAIDNSVDTFTLNSVTGLQSPGAAVIDRQDANGNDTPTAREVITWTGIAGSDLTGVTRGADNSTARSHADGALFEPVLTVGMWGGLTDALTSTAGAITATLDEDNMVSNSATALATQQSIKAYVDSGTVTMTNKTLNAPVLILKQEAPTAEGRIGWGASSDSIYVGSGSAALEIIMGNWVSYTPTLTNFTIGSGTFGAYYVKIGKLVVTRGLINCAADSAFGTGMRISLPITATATGADQEMGNLGNVTFLDNGTAYYSGNMLYYDTTTAMIKVHQADATYTKLTGTTSSVPFTVANGDKVAWQFSYWTA